MFTLKLLVLFYIFFQVLCVKRLLLDQLRWDFLQLEDHLWNMSANGWSPDEYELILITKFHHFDMKLERAPKNILRGLEPIRKIPDFLFLYSTLQDIDNKYEKFRDYQKTHLAKSKKKVKMEDIIYDILNNKTGVKNVIDQIFDITFEREGAIGTKLVEMTNDNFWCKNFQLSPQQLFYNLYNVISLSELKAYVMQQFAYLGNRLRKKGNNAQRSVLTRKEFEIRANIKVSQFGSVFKNTSADIWRCDPKDHLKGITYDQFTRILQGLIQNEVDMSATRTCMGTCKDYVSTKSYGCYEDSEFCKKEEACHGTIRNCQFIESCFSVCLASSVSSRRYDYVKYDNGLILGKVQYCSSKKTVRSWRRWFVKCHYCMCLCDEHGPRSDRYINFRPVMADTRNNRVVTGLRLVKHNRLLHLQIQEGKLLPYGYIHESTVHWVPVDNYNITDVGVKKDVDFFIMTYEHRSMALDEIQVKEDRYVITGVRFQFIKQRVHFHIHVNPFDWYTGKVQKNDGFYIYETGVNGRSGISLRHTDVPTFSYKPSNIHHSNANSYVQFTHTDFCKDAAQTTIPFIDTQDVINRPAVPLTGAGIYYKGNDGFGGFIAPKIRTYNYGKHLIGMFPKMGDRIDDVLVDSN